MGSDSACPVCVQGEGILPIHAYLKVDGDGLLIRPSSEQAAVQVDGRPVSGPLTVKSGQLVSLGALRLRVETHGAAAPPLGQRTWFRRTVKILAWTFGAVAALALVALLLRYAWFNESYVREKLVAAIASSLHREDAEVGEISLSYLNGEVEIRRLQIPNKEAFSDEKFLFKAERVHAKLDAWAFVGSLCSELRAARLTLEKPELLIERTARNGRPVTNIDDIVQQWMSGGGGGPVQLPFVALEAHVDVQDGLVRLRDGYTGVGESFAKGLRLSLDLPGLGQRLAFMLAATTSSGAERPPGELTLEGGLILVDERGAISASTVREGQADLRPKGFDIARFMSHLQWEIPVRVEGVELRVVPGKPVSGSFKVSFDDLRRFKVQGQAESESLVSVLEKDRPPLGQVPALLDVDLAYDTERGPTDLVVDLVGAKSAAALRGAELPRILKLRVEGKQNEGGGYRYFVDLDTSLEDLGATDVGQRLNLAGRMKGRLKGSANLVRKRAESGGLGDLEVDASLTQNGEVQVQAKPEVWQRTNLNAKLIATAKPNAEGRITELQASFSASSDSFTARSVEPHVTIRSLGEAGASDGPREQYEVRSQFSLKLDGQKFWKEFAPLLRLANLDQPVEENFDLRVSANSEIADTGEERQRQKILLGVEGQMRRQWKDDPKPQKIAGLVEYYPEIFLDFAGREAPAAGMVPPYLKLRLIATSEPGADAKANTVSVKDLSIVQDGPRLTLDIPQLAVLANLEELRERFEPYIDRLATMLGTDAHKAYTFTGDLDESGSVRVVRSAQTPERPTPRLDVAFDLKLNGHGVKAAGPLPGSGGKEIFTWQEDQGFTFALKGTFQEQAPASKEELGLRRLDLEDFSFEGKLGSFKLGARGVDLALAEFLQSGKRIAGKNWIDALEAFAFAGTVKPPAFDLLRSLKVLQPAPAYAGQLEMNAAFDRRSDSLRLEKFVYADATPKGEGPWLKDVDATAELQSIRSLLDAEQGGGMLAFSHLGKHLMIRALAVDMQALSSWIEKAPEQVAAWGLPAALVDPIRQKRLAPKGVWRLQNLAVLPVPAKERSWSLTGVFQHDLSLSFTAPEGVPGLAPGAQGLLTLEGPWSIDPQGAAAIAFSEDYKSVSVDVGATFDKAGVTLKGCLPEFDYVKPRNEPLKLKLTGGAFSAGGPGRAGLYRVEGLKLEGGPLQVAAAEVHAETAFAGEAERLAGVQMGSLDVTGGPLPFGLKQFALDRGKDTLAALLHVPALDLAKVSAFLPKDSPLAKLAWSGELTNVIGEFDGKLSRLEALAFKPGQDRLTLGIGLRDIRVAGQSPRQDRLNASVDGRIAMDLLKLTFPELKAALLHAAAPAGGGVAKPARYNFALDGLEVAAAEEGAGLSEAFQKASAGEAKSVRLRLPLASDTPLSLDGMLALIETAKDLFGGSAPALPAGTGNPFEALRPYVVEGSLRVPSLQLDPQTALAPVEIARFTLEDLKYAAAVQKFGYAGAPLTLTQAVYDLRVPAIGHTQHLELVEAALEKLLAGGLEAAGYRVTGKVTAIGQLSGTDVSPRQDWNGAFEVELKDLVAVKPGAAPKQGQGWIPSWLQGSSKALDLLGVKDLAFAQVKNLLPAGLDPTSAFAAASFLSADMMLNSLGFDTSRLEFEDTRVVVNLDKGVADIRQSRLKGKGPTAGLELAFRGRLRLYDRTLDDRFEIWPVSLPQGSKDKLALDRWPAAVRERFLADLAEGGFPLRILGNLEKPDFKLPYDKLQKYVTAAMFNREQVSTEKDLAEGMAFMTKNWAGSEQGLQALSKLAEMTSYPLPGTDAAKSQGGDILSKLIGGGPSSLVSRFLGGPKLSYRESLEKMLSPEPAQAAPPKRTPPPPTAAAPRIRAGAPAEGGIEAEVRIRGVRRHVPASRRAPRARDAGIGA
ncbi:MAG: hypothetical protein M5U26_00335 [Planctomycetota bacterium]|nr:hypothetical protein [Planctomycetota bacterium]